MRHVVQVVLVLSPFSIHSFKCESQHKVVTKLTKPLFLEFNVNDVHNREKPISSACYDQQQVCVYLQPFSR